MASDYQLSSREDVARYPAILNAGSLSLSAKELALPSPVRALAETLLTWGVIVGIIAVYLRFPSPWTYPIVFVLIASRQYALLILMHDAFHMLLHPSRRINDYVAAILIAAPCGSAYWSSRLAHLEHHRRLGEHGDPEFFLHCVGPPSDKRSLRAFVRHFILLISGRQAFYTHFSTTETSKVSRHQWFSIMPRLLRVAGAQCVLLSLFAAAGSWTSYLTLWVLPLGTLAVLFNGLRAFCDHANPSDEPGDRVHRLVSYVSTSIERFFVAPFHMNYHAEHHLFPYVPHYNLPDLRRKLIASPEHRAVVQWRSTYLGFVREFLRAQQSKRLRESSCH